MEIPSFKLWCSILGNLFHTLKTRKNRKQIVSKISIIAKDKLKVLFIEKFLIH